MLKAFVFGGYTIGDTILEQVIESKLDVPVDYCGSKVDLSRVTPEEHNLIIILNKNTFDLDLHTILGYIKKDLDKPLVVWKKIRTFGGAVFSKDVTLEQILVNKIFIFSGIIYIPKQYYKSTMSEVLKGLELNSVRSYFLPDKKRR